MRCRDIVATENTESLPENATLADAARLMTETGLGFLPVCDADRRVLGVLTDRDLVVKGSRVASTRQPRRSARS